MALNLIEKEIEKSSDHSLLTREQEIKRMIEALLFSSNHAITLEKMREIIVTSYPIRSCELKKIVTALACEYEEQNRAFRMIQIAGGYLLQTCSELSPYIEQLYHGRKSEKLSTAATEVLAIVAYRGPITKREIEKLRGVDSSGTIAALIERDLIEEVGRKEAPGRPALYNTSSKFLHHFGLNDRQDL